MTIRIEIKSQIGTSSDPAKVSIYEDERLVAEVTADIEYQPGADGGQYPCVILKKSAAIPKSELEQLLEKNAYGVGLTVEESRRARHLIANPELSEENCWICKMHDRVNKAIFDTGLCPGHAHYALVSKK